MKKIRLVSFWILGLLIVLLFFLWVRDPRFHEGMRKVFQWISELGEWTVAAYLLCYVIACVLFIPGTPFTMVAGIIFGVGWGSFYAAIGTTLGAVASFLLGRSFARNWVLKQIQKNDKLKAIHEAANREGWKIVFLSRLSPLFPYNLMNYVFGITQIPLTQFWTATFLGILPGTIFFVYLGSLAGDILRLEFQHYPSEPWEWALYIIGLFLTVGLTLFAIRSLNKILIKETSKE